MLRVRNGSEFLLVQHDHGDVALAVYDALGNEETFEITGVYGGELDTGPGGPFIGLVGDPFPLDGLHGGDVDRDRGIVHRGQRHAMLDDGRWLQPEPFLIAAGVRRYGLRPQTLGPSYAGANPLRQGDPSGFGTAEAWAILPSALLLSQADSAAIGPADAVAFAMLGAAVMVGPTVVHKASQSQQFTGSAGGGIYTTPLPEGNTGTTPGFQPSAPGADAGVEDLDGAQGAGSTYITADAAEGDAADTARENKRRHIFGKPEHGLQGVVEALGGVEEALAAIEGAVQGAADAGEIDDVFETQVEVGGSKVTVRGRVVDGKAKVGTAFIPEAGN